jgi:hypothetical protein
MNEEQIKSFVRWIIVIVSGWLVNQGYQLDDLTPSILGAAMAIVSLGWAIWTHTNKNKLKVAAKIDPEIEVGVPQHLIMEDPGISNVVSSKKYENVRAIK